MNPVSIPVSELIRKAKSKDSGDDEAGPSGGIKSREEWRKAKELDEARKAGTAPAAVDEEGRDINPHIPQYISSAPWYIETRGPTLKHQRVQGKLKGPNVASIHDYHERGIKVVTSGATKYRKGACENCGAITHKRKDCLERPRKIGAKFTNQSIAPDEKLLPDLNLDFDGKRDRWAGFDPAMYKAIVVDEHEKVEEAKRLLKEERMKQELLESEMKAKEGETETEPIVGPSGPPGMEDEEDEQEVTKKDVDSDDSDDEEKYADHIDMPGTKVDSKQRITVRNLRIREDVAKYLRNLDPDSAYYDPKTRAMRDDPYKNSDKKKPDAYAGENFVRYSGDTTKVLEAQKFAWSAADKGLDVSLMAEPTKAELLLKEYKTASTEIKDQVKESIVEKYGGTEHLNTLPKELIFAQTESYVEYSRQGKIVKGIEKVPVKSIYEEDVYVNNHTSVWGSYWIDGSWGYKCCHSLIKNSYCTGTEGIEAVQRTDQEMIEHMTVSSSKVKNLEESGSKDKVDHVSSGSRTVITKVDDEDVKKKSCEKGSSDEESSEESDERKKRKKKLLPEKEYVRSVTEKKSKKKKNKKRKSKKRKRKDSSSSSSSEEETADGLNKKKLKEAIKKQKLMNANLITDERHMKYHSKYEVKGVTEEEMEAFRLLQKRSEDPMANF